MKSEIVTIINNQFSGKDRELVTKELEAISLEHVMAQSDENLMNTHVAILKLAKGDVKEVGRLVECAKSDFRDVIYWASMELNIKHITRRSTRPKTATRFSSGELSVMP